MAKKGGYTISDIYQGGYSSLNPSYGDVFTGYHVGAGSLGLTTDPRTANVLQEASAKLSTGVKQIELSAIQPEIFESIPKQQLKEINRLSKLTGVDISVHGPVIEASGVTREGFSESNRESAERQMALAVERSHEINPKGNIPVTFHSSAIIPQAIPQKEKKLEEAYAINAESGSVIRVPLKKKEFPGEKKEINIQEEIKTINRDQWSENIRGMLYYADRGEEAINQAQLLARSAEAERKAGREVTAAEKRAESILEHGRTFLDDSYRQLRGLFEIGYKHSSDQEKKILEEYKKKIGPKVEQLKKAKDNYEYVETQKEIIEEGIKVLRKVEPQIFKPLDIFAKEKSAQTFANVAFNSYKEFQDDSPIISIENPPAGAAFSTGEELKKLVDEARKKFTEKAVQEGIDEGEAKRAAEKLIGVTWDVGHINMLRKYGYKAEDIIKETEAVKPFVKHIHLSDNFGGEHTELPMGMGNVPIKEMLEKLGKKGEEAKKIIEAGNWWQHFKTPPVKETLEAFGSPIYAMQMAPYWNQTLGFQQAYYGGLSGQWLPQVNYETFGAGFFQLPMELGGQRQGTQGGRMSGRPME
ncbi:MAG: hypothetical protein DRM99_05265 [Thermoplasmata archaeon]|nr:MAG: hypothetical protein DRM99_05265 [Thermoplasmata archaeon]